MDILSYILGKKAGGGGGEAVLIDKNIDANGTYNASDDAADGYKKVVVDVPTGGDEPPIPSEYQMVEYIEGTGSGAVIDTGIYPSENLSVLLKVEPLVVTGDCLFGTKGTLSSDRNAWKIFNYNEQLYCDVGNSLSGGRMVVNTPFGVNSKRYFYVGNKFTIDMDVPSCLSAGASIAFTETYPTTLFINGWDVSHSANAKWYEVKIADATGLVREFVPCYRKADNVVGMYDRVSKTFFGNTGSGGAFVAGPDIASTAEIIEIILGVSE